MMLFGNSMMMMLSTLCCQLLVVLLCWVPNNNNLTNAWIQQPFTSVTTTTTTKKFHHTTSTFLAASVALGDTNNNEEEEEEEYEYVEYDNLVEQDFATSEWLVGTNWNRSPQNIDETWVRLAVAPDGKNVAVWGDGKTGKWTLDVASQYLSISKEYIYGKEIWAGIVDDYYYLQGTVRGWSFWQPASVRAQWQAKRLNVDPEEAGTPPWYEETTQEEINK